MMKMLMIEFRKLFESFRFWVSILGVGTGLLLNALEIMRYYASVPVLDELLVATNGGSFFLLFYVLCIVGGGYGFCIEQKHRCVIYYVLRDKVSNYAMAKIAVSFWGSFLVSFLGWILGAAMIVGTIFLCGQYHGNVISGMNGVAVNLAYILGYSLLCGVMSVFAMLVSVFIVDYFIVMAMPILVYYIVLNITGWFSLPACLDLTLIYFMNYNDFVPEAFLYDMGYALLFSGCLVLCMYHIIKKGIERKMEHG